MRGGTDLTRDNQSCLRFSVEESVWFQRGQEVDSLVSISLYPDISIEEHDEYVTIRGALQLTGEYRKKSEQTAQFEQSEAEPPGQFLNEVNTREDGISELNHRFPVDITIPKNRIQNLDDVYVSVDSFDYELPGNQCLQLIADLSISGIYHPEHQKEASSNTEEVHDEADVARERSEEAMNMDESNAETEEVEQQALFTYDNEEDDVLDIIEQDDDADFVEDDIDEADADLYTPIEVEARKEAYFEPSTDPNDEEKTNHATPQVEMKSRDEEDEFSYSSSLKSSNNEEIEQKLETDVDEDTEYKEKRDENTLSLTKIFGKNSSEDFSRLKMYIVQQGDSVDSIAERYDVTVQQLLRVNQLDQDRTVHDGQILYIPLEKSRSFS